LCAPLLPIVAACEGSVVAVGINSLAQSYEPLGDKYLPLPLILPELTGSVVLNGISFENISHSTSARE
jgi:hypothetical protein